MEVFSDAQNDAITSLDDERDRYVQYQQTQHFSKQRFFLNHPNLHILRAQLFQLVVVGIIFKEQQQQPQPQPQPPGASGSSTSYPAAKAVAAAATSIATNTKESRIYSRMFPAAVQAKSAGP